MKEKDLLLHLTQESISTRVLLYYRKEIQKIYSDCYVKARLFRKTGMFPKTKDNQLITDVTLRLKSMQYNDNTPVDNIHMPFITHFFNKAEVKYIKEDNKITIENSFKENLSNYFKKIDLEQLRFDFTSLTQNR